MPAEKKKRFPLPWWLLLIVLLAAGGAWWWRQSAVAAKKYVYETASVTRGDVTSSVTATGQLQAVTKVTVGSEVSGIVQKILVDYNSRVKKGQVLAQIDPSLFQTQFEQAQASVNNQVAGYNNAVANAGNAQAGVRSAEAGIVSAVARVETARAARANAQAGQINAAALAKKAAAENENARRNFDRLRKLLKKDLVARSEVDTAETQYLVTQSTLDSQKALMNAALASFRSAQSGLDSAVADLEAARIKRQSAVSLLEAADAQIRAAKAQVRQAQATLATARVNLDRAIIRSPIDGVVLARNVSVGQTVAAQFQAPDLFTLAENLDLMQVETSVDESDVGRVKEGARATFTVDAYPGETFDGQVSQLRQAPTMVQNVVTYQAIVQTRNQGLKLKPGMTATVKIHVASRKAVLLLSNAALRFRPPPREGDNGTGASPSPGSSPSPSPSASPGARGKATPNPERVQPVWVISASNVDQLEEKKVTFGLTDGVNTEIIRGPLREGDKVVTSAELPRASGGSTRKPR